MEITPLIKDIIRRSNIYKNNVTRLFKSGIKHAVHIENFFSIKSMPPKSPKYRSSFIGRHKNLSVPIVSPFSQILNKSHYSTWTRLPVLNDLIDVVKEQEESLPLKNTAIISVQHTLGTTVDLLNSFLALGAKTENIFIAGKFYSEYPEVVNEIRNLGIFYQQSSAPVQLGGFDYATLRDINLLWAKLAEALKERAINNIIVLDHGGRCLCSTPREIFEKYPIVGLEKTNAGIINLANYGLPFPIIEIGSSAAKIVLESPLIAESVIDKMLPFFPEKEAAVICGVAGYGSIGKAVANKLLAMGHKVIVYDQDASKLQDLNGAIKVSNFERLLVSSDYIFGCTGQDIGHVEILKETIKDKTLISCSSEDKEFLSWLLYLRKQLNGKAPKNLLSDIEYQNQAGATIKILRGGFPVNFDKQDENIHPTDIQLTRALVLGGVIQAAKITKMPELLHTESYMLSPEIQAFIAVKWLTYQSDRKFPKDTLSNFEKIPWIKENSGGVYLELKNSFGRDIQQKKHLKQEVTEIPFFNKKRQEPQATTVEKTATMTALAQSTKNSK